MVDVARVQTGIRIEKRLLKVLKGIAEMHDLSLGDLIEGICLHVTEGRLPFGQETLAAAATLRTVYGLDLVAADSHRRIETTTAGRATTSPAPRAAAKRAPSQRSGATKAVAPRTSGRRAGTTAKR